MSRQNFTKISNMISLTNEFVYLWHEQMHMNNIALALHFAQPNAKSFVREK